MNIIRKIRRAWFRFTYWLRCHQLVWCVRCQKVVWSKDARYERSNVGMLAALCQDCHNELFHPFGSAKK